MSILRPRLVFLSSHISASVQKCVVPRHLGVLQDIVFISTKKCMAMILINMCTQNISELIYNQHKTKGNETLKGSRDKINIDCSLVRRITSDKIPKIFTYKRIYLFAPKICAESLVRILDFCTERKEKEKKWERSLGRGRQKKIDEKGYFWKKNLQEGVPCSDSILPE